ncbi:MAG: hypothetical protein QOF71_769 [Candidatus Eremiobacteraeota bacterium]|jgi:hypothetical protein|nr:hypothetical protein [Candidatus Eremiobacteraeota bacterium]
MAQNSPAPVNTTQVIVGWIWVGIPLTWGVIVTLQNAAKLFQ